MSHILFEDNFVYNMMLYVIIYNNIFDIIYICIYITCYIYDKYFPKIFVIEIKNFIITYITLNIYILSNIMLL